MTRPLLPFAVAALLLWAGIATVDNGILRGLPPLRAPATVEWLAGDDPRIGLLQRGMEWESAGVLVAEAHRHGLDVELVARVIEVESGFDPLAINVNADGTRDSGLCQINDNTWPWLSRMAGVEGADRMDPIANIRAGVWYLAYLRDTVGSGHKMATSYNRGISGMERHREEHGTAVTAYSRAVLRGEG